MNSNSSTKLERHGPHDVLSLCHEQKNIMHIIKLQTNHDKIFSLEPKILKQKYYFTMDQTMQLQLPSSCLFFGQKLSCLLFTNFDTIITY